MRTALAVLMVMLCAAGVMAQPSPADTVPFDHWAYDAAQLLRDALPNDFAEHVPHDRALTRYEFAMLALQATRFSLIDADAAPARPTAPQAAAVWRRLAREFLPEVQNACEDIMYLRRDHYDGAPPLPGPPTIDSALGDMATVMLHQMPGDHWLYPEVQRLLWTAPGLKRAAAPPEDRHPDDTLPFEHWAYQAMLRVAPIVFPSERDRAMLVDRAVNRWEFAILASALFRKLLQAEESVQDPEAVEITWALLALEFWPELEDMEATDAIRRVGEDHWLHATAQRVLAIVGDDGREGM